MPVWQQTLRRDAERLAAAFFACCPFVRGSGTFHKSASPALSHWHFSLGRRFFLAGFSLSSGFQFSALALSDCLSWTLEAALARSSTTSTTSNRALRATCPHSLSHLPCYARPYLIPILQVWHHIFLISSAVGRSPEATGTRITQQLFNLSQ